MLCTIRIYVKLFETLVGCFGIFLNLFIGIRHVPLADSFSWVQFSSLNYNSIITIVFFCMAFYDYVLNCTHLWISVCDFIECVRCHKILIRKSQTNANQMMSKEDRIVIFSWKSRQPKRISKMYSLANTQTHSHKPIEMKDLLEWLHFFASHFSNWSWISWASERAGKRKRAQTSICADQKVVWHLNLKKLFLNWFDMINEAC